VGHHRFKIIVDAYIVTPEATPKGKDPSETTVAETLKTSLQDLQVGSSPYTFEVSQLKVKKGKAED
jgi:hypothetical protein